MNQQRLRRRYCSVALLAEGVDRNAVSALTLNGLLWSPSSRRAWIEIAMSAVLSLCPLVALLAEGVDRNVLVCSGNTATPVALLAEGVDRNMAVPHSPQNSLPSPSSRRAWIEIICK